MPGQLRAAGPCGWWGCAAGRVRAPCRDYPRRSLGHTGEGGAVPIQAGLCASSALDCAGKAEAQELRLAGRLGVLMRLGV